MITNDVSSLASKLNEQLAKAQEGQVNGIAADGGKAGSLISPPQADSVNISTAAYVKSQNLMAQNFVGGSTRDAKHIDARQLGANAVQNLQNSMKGSLADSIEESAFWFRTEQMKNAKIMKENTESHEEVFAKQKDSIEARAAEAVAPKDENGEVIAQTPAASTAAATATPAPVKTSHASPDIAKTAQAVQAPASIDVDV